MDSILAFVDRKLHAGKESNILLFRRSTKTFVFIVIELVVISDYTKSYLSFLKGINILAVVVIGGTRTLELLVSVGM